MSKPSQAPTLQPRPGGQIGILYESGSIRRNILNDQYEPTEPFYTEITESWSSVQNVPMVQSSHDSSLLNAAVH